MTEICMIRHGETDWNTEFRVHGRSDISLNETGRRQAEIAAEHLRNQSWDVVYSSPLGRAFETASIISKAVGLGTVAIENDLVEWDFGPADGMTIEEVHRVYGGWRMIDGAEDVKSMQNRGLKILTEISERHKNKRIIVVSHGVFITSNLPAFSREDLDWEKIKLKNLSMSMLTRDEEWDLPWYNRSALDKE